MRHDWCPIDLKNTPGLVDEAFPWIAGSACQDYYNVGNTAGEGVVVDNTWSDLINNAGQPVYYYTLKFDLEHSKKVFGEDPLADYDEPFEIKMYFEIQDQPKVLGPYGGFYAEDNMNAWVHISTFKTLTKDRQVYKDYKLRFEPKPGDVIQIIGFGCDRPGDRGPNMFEITNKEDQSFADQMNPYFGHYVWKISAKRYICNSEEGAIPEFGEDGNDQMYEGNKIGRIEPVNEEKPEKKYEFNVDSEGKKKIFDQATNRQDDIYGGYYDDDDEN